MDTLIISNESNILHVSNKGYTVDYTFYDCKGHSIDGGILESEKEKFNTQEVKNEIIKMLEEHPRILNDNIMVRFDKVTENGYNLLVYVYTDALNLDDYLATSENINFKIMDILNKQRVELAYPSKTIYLKK